MAGDSDDTTPRAPAPGRPLRQSLIDAAKAARRMQRHLSPEQWETLKKISADSAAAVRAVQKAIPPDTAAAMVRAVQKTIPPETWKALDEIGREVAVDDDPPASMPAPGLAASTPEIPLPTPDSIVRRRPRPFKPRPLRPRPLKRRRNPFRQRPHVPPAPVSAVTPAPAAMPAPAPVATGLGPQADRVVRMLIREVFPPDGKKPRGFSDKAVQRRVITALAAERQRGQAPADETHLGDPTMRPVKDAIDHLGRKD